MRIVLRGDPRTKKNSPRIVLVDGHQRVLPSRAYTDYERDCLRQITGDMQQRIDVPVNVRCVYYMGTRRRVDLVNLLEATLDILVRGGVLDDDCSRVVASMNGSRVEYDRDDPRVEIMIYELGQMAEPIQRGAGGQ